MAAERRRWARLRAAVGLAAVLGGCSGGPVPSPAPSTPPPGTGAPATPAGTGAAATAPTAPATPWTASPDPGSPALPGRPPEAVLQGLVGAAAPVGELGSYTWAGGGSDAPWIVGPQAGTGRAGAALEVAFDASAPVSWTAAWASVEHGRAGPPVGGVAGSGQVAVEAPQAGGDWTLRVTATFGPGANATYYWRVTVQS